MAITNKMILDEMGMNKTTLFCFIHDSYTFIFHNIIKAYNLHTNYYSITTCFENIIFSYHCLQLFIFYKMSLFSHKSILLLGLSFPMNIGAVQEPPCLSIVPEVQYFHLFHNK